MTAKTDRRNSLRLSGHDYSQPAFYYVTICTKDRSCLLGQIKDYATALSEVGSIVQTCWMTIPEVHKNVTLDEFIIMPNHLHGILAIQGSSHCLPTIIGGFKSATTRECHTAHRLRGQQLWQRGYYDHIIRTERSLLAVRRYISDNPIKWSLDELNPG